MQRGQLYRASRKNGKRRRNRPIVAAAVLTSVLVAASALITAVILLNESTAEAAPMGRGRGYNKAEYLVGREKLLAKDMGRALGAGLVLNDKEKKIDEILLKEKRNIMERSRLDRLQYIPALSFFKSKVWMENTTTFKIIRKMPKGAALHTHEPAIASLDWVVKNITYRDDVYMCKDRDGFILLNAFYVAPDNPDCPWLSVRDQRQNAPSSDDFDKMLKQNLSMLSSDPLVDYPGVSKVWDRFNKYFEQVIPLVLKVGVLQDYFRQALQEFWEDNVQFLEVRGQMRDYQDLDGKAHDATYGVQLFKNVSDEFVKDHPDFIGAGVIMSGLRFKSVDAISEEVREAVELRRIYPDFFLGYDLVGQEDPLNSLLHYSEALLQPTQHSLEDALPYFFHAAETNWQGTGVDENLVDALLLNTTRIGHGYGLAKHPELADQVKRRAIAVEVNPISNQLLGLVSDLRNHAMVPLLADDFPLVVSSDDPATWEALPLTHDFMVAFLDMTGQNMGLAFLKQLAINSIRYSAMDKAKKERAMKLWQIKWDTFVEETVREFYN